MYIKEDKKSMLKYVYVTIHVKCTVNCNLKIYVAMFGLQ